MLVLPVDHVLRRPREWDHAEILDAVVRWWDPPHGATVASLLPRLFLQHFARTSYLVESKTGTLAGFLIGFRSSDDPWVAYIHVVGVAHEHRRTGLARGLYEVFFDDMLSEGCTEVHAITGPANRRSVAFHAAMGFTLSGDAEVDGLPAYLDYDGPGQSRVAMFREL